jgi:hypothetical protein
MSDATKVHWFYMLISLFAIIYELVSEKNKRVGLQIFSDGQFLIIP